MNAEEMIKEFHRRASERMLDLAKSDEPYVGIRWAELCEAKGIMRDIQAEEVTRKCREYLTESSESSDTASNGGQS